MDQKKAVLGCAGLVLVLLIVVAALVWGIVRDNARSKEVRAWAEGHGFRYRTGTDPSYDKTFGFPSLNQGSNRHAHHIVEGSYHGRPVFAFDYHYETSY